MISAIQVVIDVDLPVAVNVIGPAVEVVQLADAQRHNALDQTAEKLLQGRSLGIEVHEHKALPGFNADWNQAVLTAIKVLHAIELRHAFERSIQTVFPTVVRTLQNLRVAAGLGHDCRGMMPAHVVESAQRAVASANDNDGLSG